MADNEPKYGKEGAEKVCGSIKAKYGDAAIVQRFDVAKIGALTQLPAGGVRVEANISRSGIQEYRRADGSIRREYRPPGEVFAADSLASLPTVPVTKGHPGDVTPENWRVHAVGQVSEQPPRTDKIDGQDFVVAPLLVHDAATIAAITAGQLAEVSAGYAVVLDETPGTTPTGERYDAVQRGIRFNHVALLPPGHARAGRGARLRLDGNQDTVIDDTDAQSSEECTEPHEMKKIKLDGVEYVEGSPEHVAALTAKVDAAAKADAEKQAKIDSQAAEIAALRADTADAAIDTRADELSKFRERARKVLGKDYDFKGKTREQVRRDALAALKVETKDRDDSWCAIYFDARVDALPAFDYNQTVRGDASEQRQDGAPPAPDDLRGRRDAADDAFVKKLRAPFEEGRTMTLSQYEGLQGRKVN